MTLIAGDAAPINAARTHVFIVGVGSYRHLEGGAEPRPALNLGLQQLTSPPVSAKALADWFIKTPLTNPEAPLGSVELLLSPAQSYDTGNGQVQVEAATLEHIRAAFARWDGRCDAHRDNISIFYYCGHGLEKEDMVLLPEDFCAYEHNPWTHAINFQRTYRGLARTKARTQLYFIDACRQLTSEMLENPDVGGEVLKQGNLRHFNPRSAPQIFATTQGKQAFGREGEVSHFTSTLIEALDSLGAQKFPGGKWAVDTDTLGSAMTKLMFHKSKGLARPLQQSAEVRGNTIENRILHELTGMPEVKTSLACQPEQASEAAEFYIVNQQKEYRRPRQHGNWHSDIVAGVYTVGARFENTAFHDVEHRDEFILPPLYEATLEVS